MQPASREPENYSIDDMMERLKRKPSSSDPDKDGKLVTREDGTQVIRVRKRKRRSKQPHKEREKFERKKKFAQLLVLMVFVLGITGLFAGGVIYSNSRPFRDALIDKITAATGAEAELRQFRMNPTSANADLLTLTWPSGNPIESLQVRGIRADADLRSVFGKRFSGSELIGNQGTLTLRVPAGASTRHTKSDTDPMSADFERISINTLHIMPGESLPRMLRIRDCEASFYPNRGSAAAPQMRLNRGSLQAPGLPELRLDRALMEFHERQVNLAVARLYHGDDQLGEFILNGQIDLAESQSTGTLNVEMKSFDLEGILGDRMGRLFSGRIDSTEGDLPNELRFPISDPSAGEFRVNFKSTLDSPFLLKGFNFLSELAVLLDDAWFETPFFEGDVTGTIERRNGDIHIRNLNAENRSRMAIRGNLTLSANRTLAGKLDIGLPHTIVATAPNPLLDRVITESSGGFRWISIDVGGNYNSPSDNMRAQIQNAATTTTTPPPAEGGTSFEDLTRPR